MSRKILLVILLIFASASSNADHTEMDIVKSINRAVNTAAQAGFEWGWICAKQKIPTFKNSKEFANHYFPLED